MDHYNTRTSTFLDLDTPMTKLSWFKIALMGVTVVPRLLLATVVMSGMALMSTVAMWGWDESEPLSPGRYRLIRLSRCCPVLTLKLLGVHVRVEGWENYLKAEKQGVKMLLFNHISYLDAFGLVGLTAASGVSKAANLKIPILGKCVKGLQSVNVPEKNRARKIGEENNNTQAISITDIIIKRLEDPRYPMICLAPEGTCGNGKCLLKFRTGGFVPGKPVLPVCIKYRHQHLNPAWTIINEPMHFLRLMCQFMNFMEVSFLPVYNPSEEEKKDPALFAENVRKLMGKHLDVPLVEEGVNEFHALLKSGIRTTYDGSEITAPPGVIDENGFANLTLALKKTQ
ncbi:hypothetical protein BSKO_03531 [Bryopsis sp. KO-2023]|nr:hypothetical protein BSKO_03531 [Bryopsis sp. KO-2023]